MTFATDVGATEPIELWSAFVGGTMRRGFTLKN